MSRQVGMIVVGAGNAALGQEGFISEVIACNRTLQQDMPFNANIRDGRCIRGLPLNRSSLNTRPFEPYHATCGFAFVAGGPVGRTVHFNHPSGSGMISGSVSGPAA